MSATLAKPEMNGPTIKALAHTREGGAKTGAYSLQSYKEIVRLQTEFLFSGVILEGVGYNWEKYRNFADGFQTPVELADETMPAEIM